MSTIVNYISSHFIASTNYGAITNGIAILVTGLVLVLLLEKVFIDAYEGKPDERRSIAFPMVILPLLLVMVVIILLRMAQILHI